ncbi:RNA recognition motif domain [Trinorchestia longiramus]|nr:RNA recognition motif domain [Trinorchestia longiramus]
MSFKSTSKLFVTKLPWTIAHKELSEYFSQFGRVRSAQVMFNKQSGFSQGYGFVSFADEQAAHAATVHDKHILEGSKLTVIFANAAGGKRF